MAESNYFITEDELKELLQKALAAGYLISVNKNLKQRTPELVRDSKSCADKIKNGDHAFLLEREDFTRYPVALREIRREGVRYWYPRAKEGGPVVEIHYFPPFEKNGRKVVPCSLFSYHEKIINPSTRREEAAGDEIKKAFASLVGELNAVKKVKAIHSSAYVSPQVKNLIASGWKLAPPYDKETPAGK